MAEEKKAAELGDTKKPEESQYSGSGSYYDSSDDELETLTEQKTSELA